jgi:hypothetical protein
VTRRSTYLTAACLALTLDLGSAAHAPAAFIKNISTGYNDATGTLLTGGAADTDYVIGSGGTGGHLGETPLVRISPLATPWLPDDASTGSRWLVLPGTGLEGISVSPGTYFFDMAVDLTGFDAATAQLSGLRYAADNKLVAIRINGTAVFSQDTSFAEEFQSFHAVGDLGLGQFRSGQNVIRFELLNSTSGVSPLGFRVEGTVEGQAISPVPEPSSLCSAGLGIALLAAWRFALVARRPRRCT